MKQEYKYTVTQLTGQNSSILSSKDERLVNSYLLGTVSPFTAGESRLDALVFDSNGNLLETFEDTPEYAIRGVSQGTERINNLEVDPTVFMQGRTYLGDVIVEYRAYDYTFRRGTNLYISEISSDRTELRVETLDLNDRNLRYRVNQLQDKLNNRSYSSVALLEIEGIQIPVLNAVTEVVRGELVVALKLYSPLPVEIQPKTQFQVLESLGEAERFQIHRELTVIEDAPTILRGPNFEVDVNTSTIATDYKNYTELLSYKSLESSKELYTTFKQALQHISINYEDFGEFVHFSSAFERLENARYKFELLFGYQRDLEIALEEGRKDEADKLARQINGLKNNFDHYENYLFYESGSAAWPKKKDPETGLPFRPYVPDDDPRNYEDWYEELLEKAEAYDNTNKDLITNTVPAVIREDLDNNEPYLIFLYMIGQHFDDVWIYAKALTDRYKADNRLDFGISKELVKDALESFGVDLYESNQNLTALFDLCKPDGTYTWGSETGSAPGKPEAFIRVDTDEEGNKVEREEYGKVWLDQPVLRENYTREVYKRIYHNIPLLLKTKGTSRGLRVLLNCFGIPNDILTFKVEGGINSEKRPFFGPEESLKVSPEYDGVEKDLVVSGSRDKIRLSNKNEPILEFKFVDGTGSFYKSTALSRYTSVTESRTKFTDDSHKTEVGFSVTEAANEFFRKYLSGSEFTVDDVIGDPRNTEEQYGDVWKPLREQILDTIPVSEDEEEGDRNQFRSPAAIIRLVRYFDVTFFRLLQDFLPARAVVSSGAIIKDNCLHRSRWKGVRLTLKECSESGSTSGSTIYGSHGGAFQHGGERFDTGDKEYVSAGDHWELKNIPSGSREFNGELTGSLIKTTDGDLSKYNPHRKDVQPDNDFTYNVFFLDLPDIPLCSVKLETACIGNYWEFRTVNYGPSPTLLTVFGSSCTDVPSFDADLRNDRWYGFFDPSMCLSNVEVTDYPNAVSGSEKLFFGWFSGSEDVALGHASTPGLGLHILEYPTENNQWQAVYRDRGTADLHMFWTKAKTTGSLYYYDYEYGASMYVLWKYLEEGKSPQTYKPTVNDPVITIVGGCKIKVWVGSEEAIAEIPDQLVFGSNDGIYIFPEHQFADGEIHQYGLVSLGDYTSPFYLEDGTIVDASWFDTYDNWPSYVDPVEPETESSGSGNLENDENEYPWD